MPSPLRELLPNPDVAAANIVQRRQAMAAVVAACEDSDSTPTHTAKKQKLIDSFFFPK